MSAPGRVLIVAGSDSGGGAGIQADLKTVQALGGYGMTAITALTAQNTLGVHGVHAVDPAFIVQQMDVVLDDLGADAIKTGMLATTAVIDAVAGVLERPALRAVPLVVDPVMVAKGGHPLLADDAIAALKRRILVLADVLTPNVPEAELLSGMTIRTPEDLAAAGAMLRTLGPAAVVMKGGHLDGAHVVDLLVTEEGIARFEGPRIETRHTHGTGCTLASAIATGLAQGLALTDAVMRARAFVARALETAPGLGRGHGPLNHGYTVGQGRLGG